MSQRLAAFIALAVCILLLIAAWAMGDRLGLDDGGPSRISFQIATGSTEGIYFPVGQAMAGVISHPPGVARCETATVCGPAGVILSARTSQSSIDNLRGVNGGTIDSGLAEGDTIAAAVDGQGPFRRGAKARHLRVIAGLFHETINLVVAANSNIHTVSDLRGKKVMLGGADDSAAAWRTRNILSAYRVWARLVPPGAKAPGQALRDGDIDAYFLVASGPADTLRFLIARGVARLVPIDGEGRDRLLRQWPALTPTTIAAGTYLDTPATDTLSVSTYWVTRDSEPDPMIYGMTRALFNPANRALLTASDPAARDISIDTAAQNPPAPLHSGAARFYREMGKL